MLARTVTVSDASGGVKYSSMVRFDDFAPSNISIQCNVTGTANYTIQSSLDDPNDPISPVAVASMVWVDTSDLVAVGATTSLQTNFLFAPKFARVKLNSGSGSVRATFLQSSVVPK
jgi:hypothetical protein